MGGLKTVGGWFKWLWDNAVKPAFNGIKAVISAAWDKGIRPVFDKLKAGTKAVGDAFEAARKAIKTAWDKLEASPRSPWRS
ncbi:hypothetical protein D3C59_34915 [Streptomyces sp. SHP22-7]|nr:hypothetical protein D3C59_34915 [Streptomyces sp. SHP22-7]